MSGNYDRDCLLNNLAEHYLHEMVQEHHTSKFIKDTLMYGCEEIPLDELDTEVLREMWYEILEEAGEDIPEDSDWEHPSEYELGYGEEFPNE